MALDSTIIWSMNRTKTFIVKKTNTEVILRKIVEIFEEAEVVKTIMTNCSWSKI